MPDRHDDETYDSSPDRTDDETQASDAPTEATPFIGRGAVDEDALFRELASAGAGHYRPVQELGSGGMGVVILAEQVAPVRRQVALKVIKLGMDTQDVVSRFESERQALAVMDHPNIAHVYDAGATESGRPYFVMELVRGQPLIEFCDARELSVRDRLQLFIDICRGVQHAHQKGVIHRDLKPSNILVTEQDGKPAPKIIDFGVAKATGHTRLAGQDTLATVAGAWVGTPAYMSPEQAGTVDLDIDTRTDVYSLGVMLYELLTGERPIRFGMRVSPIDIQRAIQTEAPETPSTRISRNKPRLEKLARLRKTDASGLRRELRGDLDWIVMKALEKERERRYETANGLALDVQRFLDNEPISARPPSKLYSAKKFVQRNRLGVGMAALLLTAMIAGTVGTGLGFFRAQRETRRATAVKDFLVSMLGSIAPNRAKGREVTVREVLDGSIGDVEKSFASTPRVEAELRELIGTMYDQLGVFESSEPQLKRALELYSSTLGEESDAYLRTLNQLGILYFHQGRLSKAVPPWRRLLEIYDRVRGPEHRDTLTTLQNLGAVLLQEGEYAEAEPLLKRVLESRRRLLGSEHRQTTATMNNLAHLYLDTKRFDEAEPLFRDALEIRRKMLGNRNTRTLTSAFNLGELELRRGNAEEATPLLREALDGFRELVGDDHPNTIESQIILAEALLAQGRLEEAQTVAAEGHAACVRRYGEQHPETSRIVRLLVEIHEKSGRRTEALRWREKLPLAAEEDDG